MTAAFLEGCASGFAHSSEWAFEPASSRVREIEASREAGASDGVCELRFKFGRSFDSKSMKLGRAENRKRI